MIDNKTKYEISEMRKKLSNKNFYSWLKENKICPGCKNALSDDGFVKSYNKNRNRKD